MGVVADYQEPLSRGLTEGRQGFRRVAFGNQVGMDFFPQPQPSGGRTDLCGCLCGPPQGTAPQKVGQRPGASPDMLAETGTLLPTGWREGALFVRMTRNGLRMSQEQEFHVRWSAAGSDA